MIGVSPLGMGGYAAYVWPAYGAVMVVFGLLYVHARYQEKRVWRRLRRLSEVG